MKTIGVFGTCRIADWNLKNIKQIREQYPLTYSDDKYNIIVRPLGYTTSASDAFQVLELVNGNHHKNIKDFFLYKNLFLKHNNNNSNEIIDNIDYDYLIIEVCSKKKLVHKKSNYVFPYHCAMLNGRTETFGKDLNKNEYSYSNEPFNETIEKIIKIRDLLNTKIILLPPIIEFNIKESGGAAAKRHTKAAIIDQKNKDINHTIAYREDIISRLIKASAEDDIYFINWNNMILEKGIDVMVADQFHFTDYGQKYLAEYIYNFIETLRK